MNNEIGQINLIDYTDIIPVFKSSNIQFWTILCMFGGFHPFLLTVFFGEKKTNDVSLIQFEKISLISNINIIQSIFLHLFVMDQLGNFRNLLKAIMHITLVKDV